MAQVTPLRVNESWVNLTGEMASPRYVIITDKIARELIPNLAQSSVNDRDLVVELKQGTFENAEAFLRMKQNDLVHVEAFVFLWMGTEELCFDDSSLPPPPLPSTIEAYFHPDGPKIFPRLSAAEVVAKYQELVLLTSSLFPSASVFSTDPAPRRSSGFAIARAKFVTRDMKQQNDRHHHISLIHKFHGRRAGGQADKPGGNLPLYDRHFIDGVFPKIETWSVLFDRAYAAIASIKNAASAAQLLLLSEVKIMF